MSEAHLLAVSPAIRAVMDGKLARTKRSRVGMLEEDKQAVFARQQRHVECWQKRLCGDLSYTETGIAVVGGGRHRPERQPLHSRAFQHAKTGLRRL